MVQEFEGTVMTCEISKVDTKLMAVIVDATAFVAVIWIVFTPTLTILAEVMLAVGVL